MLSSSSGDGHASNLAAHVARLQGQGRSVLFVTADRPLGSWTQPLQEASVDHGRLLVIDAVSAMGGQAPSPRPANATYLSSPAMLEMLALRIEQQIVRHAPVRVVVDSLNTLALYNGLPAVQAFAHYLANRLRTHRVGADLVVCSAPDGAAIRDRVAPFIDHEVHLETLA